MALRITDNQMMMTRPPEMASDRVREMRQTGLTTGTLNEIVQDTEDELHTVRDRPEVEEAYVRTDEESENKRGEQQEQQRERGEAPPEDSLQKRASARLLNLPVSRGSVTEERRFDIRV